MDALGDFGRLWGDFESLFEDLIRFGGLGLASGNFEGFVRLLGAFGCFERLREGSGNLEGAGRLSGAF